MKGIHPKAFNRAEFELLFLSPRAEDLPLPLCPSLPAEFILQCATVAARGKRGPG